MIYAANNGFVDKVPTAAVTRYGNELVEYIRASHAGLLTELREKKQIDDSVKGALEKALKAFAEVFEPNKK